MDHSQLPSKRTQMSLIMSPTHWVLQTASLETWVLAITPFVVVSLHLRFHSSDAIRPTAILTTSIGTQPVTSTITVTFSEPVLSFSDADLDVSGIPGLVTTGYTLSGDRIYLVTLSGATEDGTFSVSISETTDVTDYVLNPFNSSNTVTRLMGTNSLSPSMIVA